MERRMGRMGRLVVGTSLEHLRVLKPGPKHRALGVGDRLVALSGTTSDAQKNIYPKKIHTPTCSIVNVIK